MECRSKGSTKRTESLSNGAGTAVYLYTIQAQLTYYITTATAVYSYSLQAYLTYSYGCIFIFITGAAYILHTAAVCIK